MTTEPMSDRRIKILRIAAPNETTECLDEIERLKTVSSEVLDSPQKEHEHLLDEIVRLDKDVRHRGKVLAERYKTIRRQADVVEAARDHDHIKLLGEDVDCGICKALARHDGGDDA